VFGWYERILELGMVESVDALADGAVDVRDGLYLDRLDDDNRPRRHARCYTCSRNAVGYYGQFATQRAV